MMTGIKSPLPAREGLGVGASGAAASSSANAERAASRRAPTPSPSLQAGRGVDSSRLATSDNLERAGKQFEAVFTGMMLASMRKASLAEPLFSSQAIDTFREMQDKLVTQSMAEHAPIGIGRAMTEFLSRSQPDLNAGPSNKAE